MMTNPRAELYTVLMQHFDSEALQTLCFGLGVDYDALPGDAKGERVIGLISEMARTTRISDLLQGIAAERPNLDLTALRAADVAAFNIEVPVLNPALPQRRLLLIGGMFGALTTLLVACGFSGGLVAARVIDGTVNPVPASPAKLSSGLGSLSRISNARPGTPVDEELDSEEATSLVQAATRDPNSPVSDVHVKFLPGNEVSVNLRVKALNNAQIVLLYGVRAVGGRAMIDFKTGAINAFGQPGGRFGWIALPAASAAPATEVFQRLADSANAEMTFADISTRDNAMRVRGVAK